MNIYEQSKDNVNGRLAGIGDPPSRAEIAHALEPGDRRRHKSSATYTYGRFLREYGANWPTRRGAGSTLRLTMPEAEPSEGVSSQDRDNPATP